MTRRHLGLRPKVLLGALVPLVAILGLQVAVQAALHERYIRDLSARSAEHTAGVVQSALTSAMLTGDRRIIQAAIDQVAGAESLEGVTLLDPAGVVRAASGSGLAGRTLSTADAGCAECHAPGQRPVVSAAVLADGQRTMRACRPVPNAPACRGCHDPSQDVTGVLLVDVPLAAVESHLADYNAWSLLALAAAVVIGGVVLGGLLDRLVVSPLDDLTAAARAVARGDTGRQPSAPEGDSDSTDGSGSGDELADLARALAAARSAMADRVALEAELRARGGDLEAANASLREKEALQARLLAQTIDAQESERRRVARQLHDELAQALSGLLMSLDVVLDRATDPVMREQAERTREIAAVALDQTRRLILDLRPSMLDDLGLVSAIRWYAETRLGRSGALVALQVVGAPRRLPPAVETAIFRIAQEAIANVARHASARRVDISLEWVDDGVGLIVSDDGRGFDPAAAVDADTGAGMGLLGMRERAQLLGATLDVESAPGAGTRVALRMPTSRDEGSAP